MPLWDVNLHKWEGTNFKDIRPDDILAQYDGPLTFTFRDANNNKMLAHLSDEEAGVVRYIVAPVLDRDVERLRRGTISLFGALNQPILWVLDIQNGGVTKSWVGNFDDLPKSAVPEPDVMLHPNLEPMIKLRVPDVRYRYGSVAVGALRYLIDGAEAAMRRLTAHLKVKDADLYELEAQQLAFNSIEIAFQPGKRRGGAVERIEPKDKAILRIESFLGKGLKWIASHGEQKLPHAHEKAILSAVRELTPKKDGQIMKIEVSGRIVGHDAGLVELTTDTRIALTERIKSKKPKSIDRVGIIRELDEDSKTFQLREIVGHKKNDVTFVFSQEQHDLVYGCLGRGNQVRVSGDREKNRYRLVDLEDQANLE